MMSTMSKAKKKQNIDRSGRTRHRRRLHGRKLNALCVIDDIMSEENFCQAKEEEIVRARTLKSEKLTDTICRYNQTITRVDFIKTVQAPGYRLHPFSTTDIPKPNGKLRRLYIQQDPAARLLERMLFQKLSPILEKQFSDCSYAYRPGRSMVDLLKDAARHAPVWKFAAKVDISKYFDTIDHHILHEELQKALRPDQETEKLLALVLKPRYYDRGEKRILSKNPGVPQGAVMAPLLANFYATPVDKVMEGMETVKYFRYADDILILGKRESDVDEALNTLVELLAQRKLLVNEEKLVKGVLRGLEYLGVRFGDGELIEIPAVRLRDKLKEIFSLAIERDVMPRLSGLLLHYWNISPALLQDRYVDEMILAESGDMADKALEVLKAVRSRKGKQLWKDLVVLDRAVSPDHERKEDELELIFSRVV